MRDYLGRMSYESLNFIKKRFTLGSVSLAPKQGNRPTNTDINSTSKEEIDMCLNCDREKCTGGCNKIRNKEYKK